MEWDGRKLNFYDIDSKSDYPLDKCYYGAELEVCCESLAAYGEAASFITDNREILWATDDSSVYPYGIEIKNHPMTEERMVADETISSLLSFPGLYTNETCGGHIHLSTNSLSPANLRRIVEFVFSNPEFFHWFSGRTKNNLASWARIYEDDAPGRERILGKCLTKGTGPGYCRDGGAVGFNAGTLEFRLFRGTKTRQEFFRNVQLISLLVQLSNRHVSFQEFLEVSSADDSRPYLKAWMLYFMGKTVREVDPKLLSHWRNFRNLKHWGEEKCALR